MGAVVVGTRGWLGTISVTGYRPLTYRKVTDVPVRLMDSSPRQTHSVAKTWSPRRSRYWDDDCAEQEVFLRLLIAARCSLMRQRW